MLICLEESVLVACLVRFLASQFSISLEGLLSGLPVLSDGGLGAEYAFEHLHIIFRDSFALLPHCLLIHGPPSALIAITASIFPEGSLGALVNLSQFGTDLVVGSPMFIPIKWRQSMRDGGMCRLWYPWGECGLGSE